MSHFVPLDQKAHEAANNGKPVEDYCRNCGYEFMDHYNGRCPEDDDEDELAAAHYPD